MFASRIAATAAFFVLTVAPLAVAGPALADSSTPQGASFGKLYYHDTVVRTVLTPASQPGRGIDPIYPIMGGVAGQMPVTAAAPGDNYHGGRWAVHVVTWNTSPYLLTSDEAVLAAAAAGEVTITRMPAADFVCPVAGR